MPNAPPAARVVSASGPRAVEAWLLARLRAHRDQTRADPGLLAEPVRVLVPSALHRAHWTGRIAGALGALLGVEVQTAWSAALAVLERAGIDLRASDALFDVLARRAAAAEPSLRDALDELDDGYALAAAGISDLLSAGLEPRIAAAAQARLGGASEHSRALLRAALAAQREASTLSIARHGEVYERAASALRDRGRALLRQRALYLVGFADATGQVAGFLGALLEACAGTLLLSEPPDALAAQTRARHPRRLLQLVRPQAEPEELDQVAAPAQLELYDACGAEDELREAVRRAQERIARGTPPERIAFVARALEPYALAARRVFPELGLPASGGLLPEGLLPEVRLLAARVEVCRRDPHCPCDTWLDALDGRHELWARREDLRLALRRLGAARLGDLAGLELERLLGADGEYVLATRGAAGSEEERAGEAEAGARRRKRTLPGLMLYAARALARELVARLARAAEPAPAAAHARALAELLALLGHDSESDPAADEIARDVPAGMLLTRAEHLRLYEARARQALAAELCGAGGGVQLLEAEQARGLAFEQVHLLGLARGSWPRPAREQPLLDDGARARLRAVLPALALKRDTAEEERHLLAELLAGAPRAILSWQRADETGAARAAAPLVLGLLRRAGLDPQRDVAHVARRREDALAPPHSGGPSRPRTARANLMLAGLRRERGLWREILPLALAEGRALCGLPELPGTVALAAARAAILEERDPEHPRPGMSPYFGLVVPRAGMRASALYVTQLEQTARCPWQTFLVRALGLEALPDPVAALPDLDNALLGSAVHAALDEVLRSRLPGERRTLEQALRTGAVELSRPAPADIERALQASSVRALAEAGILLAGLARALAARARPYVERALELGWPGPGAGLRVLAVEVEGECALPRAGREPLVLRFRADRADALADGVVLSDYKTGRHYSKAAKPETRAQHLSSNVSSGALLQAAAYAGSSAGATGQYLHVHPDLPLDRACSPIEHGDDIALKALMAASGALAAAWERGVLPPRLESPDKHAEPEACKYCELTAACLRGDSGARRRLAQAAHDARASAPSDSRAELLASLWYLGQAAEDGGKA